MSYLTTLCAWTWFALVQLICLIATIVGWILLIPFCLIEAWIADISSAKDGRPIDRWSWKPLNSIYGNREDGVSGQTALIWVNGSLSFYRPRSWAPARAYLWSAWRNSANGLKYMFQWKGGPLCRKEWKRWYVQFGWNTSGLPVLSAGSV